MLHGGPEFDSSYLLPELDALHDAFRLTYYDQRGRGRSAEGVSVADVSLASEIEDLDMVRQRLGLEEVTLVGHGWGALLALEYARRHPGKVSRLILLDPLPVSTTDAMIDITPSAAPGAGHPDSVAAALRERFRPAVVSDEVYERVMARMRAALLVQGRVGINRARAIADRLLQETLRRPGYDLLPELRALAVPTLIVSGERGLISSDVAGRLASAIPNALLVTIPGCGHFVFAECAGELRRAIDSFTRRTAPVDFPLVLRFDAADRKCVPVLDTLAFPGLRTPLWRYGVYEEGADTLRKASAAFWCSMSKGESETAIVIWRDELMATPLPGGCERVIRYRGAPGGLRFERRGSVPLRDASPVDEPSLKGPPIVARGMVIVAEHEGRTARFICHTGRWWVQRTVAP